MSASGNVVKTVWHGARSLAVALLAGLASAQLQDRLVPDAYWVVHDTDADARTRTLHALRASVLARDARAEAAHLQALQDQAQREQAALVAAVQSLGGRVRFEFWLTNAVTVQMPSGLGADALRALLGVRQVLPVTAAEPTLRNVTGDRLTNADRVQQDRRLCGATGIFAVIDSGVARDMGNGQPHRTFRRLGGPGHRLIATYGIAPHGVPPPPPDDFDGHGTAVAAIAGGIDWGVPPFSDHGFAYDADLVSYRVVDQTGLAPDDAITVALQRIALDRVRHNAGVANISLAGRPDATHPQQVVLDTLGYFSDVLVVTAAGNDGYYPHSSARSHCNCSGLVVGALLNDRRQVDASSTWGPLTTDGERFWPDIMALGQMHTAKHDDETVARFVFGTSFSAPQVTGTATMLRAADPQLTALDVKAILLHGVEDIAAANPTYGRFRYGLGMLRTDQAFDAWQRDRLEHGALQRGVTESLDFHFDFVAGRRYALTMCFARTSPGNFANWDNLDLYVYGPDTRLRAASETARNLYEKIVFAPHVSGRHRVQVVGRSFTTPGDLEVPFTLMVGEDRSGAAQPGSYLHLGDGCLGRGESPASGLIMPPTARANFGNDNTRVPFAEEPVRLQQVIEHAWFGSTVPLTLHRIGFRRDNNEANTPNWQVDVDLDLGFSSYAASQMQLSFPGNANLGPMTRVRSGRIDMPGANRRSEFPYWDYVIAFDTPFVANTGIGRNLLVEITTRGNSQGNQPINTWFDAITDISLGRIYQFANGGQLVFEPTALVMSLMQDGLWPAAAVIDPVGDARPGSAFSLVVRHATPDAAAVLVWGLSRTSWNGLALPFDLTPLGARGCHLYTDWFVQVPIHIANTGVLRTDWSVPPISDLSGTVLHTQVIVNDPLANPLGISVSSGGRIVVGG